MILIWHRFQPQLSLHSSCSISASFFPETPPQPWIFKKQHHGNLHMALQQPPFCESLIALCTCRTPQKPLFTAPILMTIETFPLPPFPASSAPQRLYLSTECSKTIMETFIWPSSSLPFENPLMHSAHAGLLRSFFMIVQQTRICESIIALRTCTESSFI